MNNLDQIANTLSQASYVLSNEGNNLTAKDIDAIISKLETVNYLLCKIHDSKKESANGQMA